MRTLNHLKYCVCFVGLCLTTYTSSNVKSKNVLCSPEASKLSIALILLKVPVFEMDFPLYAGLGEISYNVLSDM